MNFFVFSHICSPSILSGINMSSQIDILAELIELQKYTGNFDHALQYLNAETIAALKKSNINPHTLQAAIRAYITSKLQSKTFDVELIKLLKEQSELDQIVPLLNKDVLAKLQPVLDAPLMAELVSKYTASLVKRVASCNTTPVASAVASAAASPAPVRARGAWGTVSGVWSDTPLDCDEIQAVMPKCQAVMPKCNASQEEFKVVQKKVPANAASTALFCCTRPTCMFHDLTDKAICEMGDESLLEMLGEDSVICHVAKHKIVNSNCIVNRKELQDGEALCAICIGTLPDSNNAPDAIARARGCQKTLPHLKTMKHNWSPRSADTCSLLSGLFFIIHKEVGVSNGCKMHTVLVRK